MKEEKQNAMLPEWAIILQQWYESSFKNEDDTNETQ